MDRPGRNCPLPTLGAQRHERVLPSGLGFKGTAEMMCWVPCVFFSICVCSAEVFEIVGYHTSPHFSFGPLLQEAPRLRCAGHRNKVPTCGTHLNTQASRVLRYIDTQDPN